MMPTAGAWFFLMVKMVAYSSPTVVGPFDDKETCVAVAKEARSFTYGAQVTDCWHGPVGG